MCLNTLPDNSVSVTLLSICVVYKKCFLPVYLKSLEPFLPVNDINQDLGKHAWILVLACTFKLSSALVSHYLFLQ